jgi:competence protein ComEC
MAALAAAVAAGAVWLRHIPGASYAALMLLSVGSAMALVMWRGRSPRLWVALALALFGLAALRAGTGAKAAQGIAKYSEEAVLTGEVAMDSGRYGGKFGCFLRVIEDSSGTFFPGEKVMADLPQLGEAPGWGERVTMRADLARFRADIKEYAGMARCSEIMGREPSGSALHALVNRLRSSFEDFCRMDVGGGSEGSLMSGMIMGDVGRLDGETATALRRAGLSHLCAASGLHAGILAGMVTALLARMGLSRSATAAAVFATLALYVMMVGGRSPIVRASLLVPLALAAYLAASRYHPLSALSMVFISMILWEPGLLDELSFQMSFSAAFGIVLFSGPILRAMHPLKGKVAGLAACTLAAQMSVAPLTAARFGELSLVAPLVNMMVLPGMPVAMGSGILGGLARAADIPLLPWILGKAGRLFACYIFRVSEVMGSLRFSTIYLAQVPKWAIALYALLVIAILAASRSVLLQRGLLAALLVMTVTMACSSGLGAGITSTRVIFFDVGQGDCFLFESRGGIRIMIDGGEDEAKARDRVQRYGIRHLDAVILSHPDSDHVGGLDAVMEECRVDLVLETGAKGGDPYLQWRRSVEEEGSQTILATAGCRIELGDVTVEVMGPLPEAVMDGAGNDASLVCRVSTPELSLLATGDIEEGEELELLATAGDIHADVLKVPHHGGFAESGEWFFQGVGARVAVISVGRDNRYGHPHAATLQALAAAGSSAYRTDELGDIIVESKEGGRLAVSHAR